MGKVVEIDLTTSKMKELWTVKCPGFAVRILLDGEWQCTVQLDSIDEKYLLRIPKGTSSDTVLVD